MQMSEPCRGTSFANIVFYLLFLTFMKGGGRNGGSRIDSVRDSVGGGALASEACERRRVYDQADALRGDDYTSQGR